MKVKVVSGGPAQPCTANATKDWPIDLDNQQCMQLAQVPSAVDVGSCLNACCAVDSCQTYQWCPAGSTDCSPAASCWIGNMLNCQAGAGWVSRGRNASAPPAPVPGKCSDPGCEPGTDDAAWRVVNLPHDFVVENDASQSADKSHGYLPYASYWYRKHFTLPASAAGSTIYIEVEAAQTKSQVYLNGFLLGTHDYGYTPNEYYVNSTVAVFGGDNVLAIFVDATEPDSWWYDGGGLYRHVWLNIIPTPGPYLGPDGIYAPAAVTGTIGWTGGAPFADASLSPSVEVWSNATAASPMPFCVALTVRDASGAAVGAANGCGSAAGGGAVTTWSPPAPIALPGAALWHLVAAPLSPALYTLDVALTVSGAAVDAASVTFGVRAIKFDAASGFYLNGVATKIKGMANHQDMAAVGVGVPDHLQAWRILKQKEFGANGWRCAHNPPTPALLDAADSLGFVVWDETHRNGNLPLLQKLIRRDRNRASVVIWSLCNEVLCNTPGDWVADAKAAKALIRTLDPLGQRPVSANQNGWIGPNTPLDVQGFDYSTGSYDGWHAAAPGIPSISSETSSAVSDRGEYANNETAGHVQAYDNQYPGWGESAEQAWGGVGVPANQGILTRPFISGGWVWTGHDYRGEPTPYGWPDVNSHFGIIDAAGFPKDRFYWYAAHFLPDQPLVWLLPQNWNWEPSVTPAMDVWVYSNAASVELFLNGASLGARNMTQYGHAEWDKVPTTPGSLHAVGSDAAGAVVAEAWVNTTGPAAGLRISVKDGAYVGGADGTMVARCNDAALVQVEVVDASGAVVPTASNNISFALAGEAVPGVTLAGTSNGDPACLVNSKSPWRPAFHGLVMAVVIAGDSAGTVTVTASSPGFQTVSVQLPVVAASPAQAAAWWCRAAGARA